MLRIWTRAIFNLRSRQNPLDPIPQKIADKTWIFHMRQMPRVNQMKLLRLIRMIKELFRLINRLKAIFISL